MLWLFTLRLLFISPEFFSLSSQLLPVEFVKIKPTLLCTTKQTANPHLSVSSILLLYFSVIFFHYLILNSPFPVHFFPVMLLPFMLFIFSPLSSLSFASLSDPSSLNWDFPMLLYRLLFFQPCKSPWLQWKCVAAESLLLSLIFPFSLCWASPSLFLGLILGLVIHSWLSAEITILSFYYQTFTLLIFSPEKELYAIIFTKSRE